jgi:hypothetical protein
MMMVAVMANSLADVFDAMANPMNHVACRMAHLMGCVMSRVAAAQR